MPRIKTDYVNGGYSFAIDYETLWQDYDANVSSVRFTVKLISNGASYTINSSAPKGLTLTVNGIDYSTNVMVALNGNQEKTLFTKVVNIQHNADGTKLLSFDATLAIQVTLSDVWYDNFWTGGETYLAQIPRESSIASVTENVIVNGTNKLTVNITRKYSSYKHSVSIRLGDYVTTIENVDTQCQFAIPTSWLGAIPNTVTGTGTVFVTTFNGTRKIGSTYSKDFKVTVPNDYIPSFTDISIERINNDVPADWGIYVQGYSDCKASIIGAAGIYGSSIKKFELQIGDNKATAQTMTSDLPKSGTVTIKGTVTDSRGRKVSTTKTINVVRYTLPVLDSVKLFRANSSGVEADEGTYIGGKIDFSYAQIGTNSVATSIEYKRQNDSDWTYAGTYANNQAFTLGGGNLTVDDSYQVRIGLADELGWIGKVVTLGTSFTTMDLLKGGKGIAFGKVAESANLADFGFKARFRNGFTVDGGITPDHLKNLKAITQEAEVGQYVRLLSFPFKMNNYNSYNITLAYSETIYGEINGFLDFHLRTIVNRFDIRKLQVRARTGTAAQSDFYADFKDGVCSIYWKPATEYARLKMTVFGWAAYENTEVEPSNVYTLDGTHVFGSIGSDFIRVTQQSALNNVNGAVVSSGADYAEYGDWADGNPGGADRKGYFVTIEQGSNDIRIAKADSAIIGVTTDSAGFIGNYSEGAESDAGKGLVGIVGQISVIDNGTCEIGKRCMPGADGTAVPSSNNCGYLVIERIDASHVRILVAPTIDMIQRIKTDVSRLQQIGVGGGGNVDLTNIVDMVYPVGSIYMSVNEVDPSVIFGGTWERIKDTFLLAAGDSYSAGSVGGESSHTLTVAEMPSHTHTQNAHSHDMSHTHSTARSGFDHYVTATASVGNSRIATSTSGTRNAPTFSYDGGNTFSSADTATGAASASTTGERTATNQNTGGGKAHNNMPPYLTCYMWKRTA